MPIYDYECMSCRKHFELIHTISEANDAACPMCGARMLKKKVSHFNSKEWSTFLDRLEEKVKSPFCKPQRF